jgi:YHS domain-containing protein
MKTTAVSLAPSNHLLRLVFGFLLVLSFQVNAEAPIYTSFFSDQAVSGFDTVAYFREGKPVEGSEKFSTEYKGAQWLFKNQANLDAFLLAPDSYAPQYGGYCAWAVAHDNTAKGEPDQWHITNGKLYLNYNAEIRGKWLKDKEALIKTADSNWPKVLK